MRPIAIIGAAGFVGSRLIETCMLSGIKDIHPIVRNNYNLARLCRYGLDDRVRIADAENEKQLLEAINGSPIVVNLVRGDPGGIIKSTKVIHKACIDCGVKRLIHLSSAVIFGQVESSHIHDDSPFEKNHWMPYARAKIAAENFLRDVSGLSSLEIVMLRPGIVWGPRSNWSFNAAVALKEKTAFLVDAGLGICNTIYIDNLVASILVCCAEEPEVSGSYNVADNEVVTWRDFYASLSDFLCYDMSLMPKVASDRFKPTIETMLLDIKSTALYNKFKKSITLENREMIKQWLAAFKPIQTTPQANENKHQPKLLVSREMWNLQKTKHKLPTKKFSEKFNFTPPVSFHDGTQMTINWLKFLGF
jgi:nucleoside-diphosphate-sugar epimerase